MLNNEFTLLQASHFADRVWSAAGANPEKQVSAMYRIAFSREPSPSEMRNNLAFLEKQKNTAKVTGEPAMRSALGDLAHVVLNLNEFVYIN